MLSEKIGIVEFTREPFYEEFTETNTITDPVVTHCDCFGLLRTAQ